MTIILDIAPDVRQAIAEAADRQGTTLERLASETLRTTFMPAGTSSAAGDVARRSYVSAIIGKYALLGVSSADVRRERQEDERCAQG